MESEVRELLIEQLKDAYSAEKQALRCMQKTVRVLHPAVWTRGKGYAASLRSGWFQAARAAAGLR